MITLYTFGMRHTKPDEISARAVDCRGMKNPYHVAHLKGLTGLDREVQDWLQDDPIFHETVEHVINHVVKHGSRAHISLFCVGGKHRSVAVAEVSARKLRECDYRVDICHGALNPLHS